VISADQSPDREPRAESVSSRNSRNRSRHSCATRVFSYYCDCDRHACRCTADSKRTQEFFSPLPRRCITPSCNVAMTLHDISERPYLDCSLTSLARCSCQSRITAAITRPFSSAPSPAPIAQCQMQDKYPHDEEIRPSNIPVIARKGR
jgi:hypothetical protein